MRIEATHTTSRRTLSRPSTPARELRCDGIEFDVHATADGELVIIHDYDLSRTTTGVGLVHERDLAYVRGLGCGLLVRKRF